MTEKILLKGKQRLQSLELLPFGDGRFEVFMNDKLVYSKLETGTFPDEDRIVGQIL